MAARAVVVLKAEFADGASLGTGFFITSDGCILTNRHVVKKDAQMPRRLTVILQDGKTFEARGVAANEEHDLATVVLQKPFEDVFHLSFSVERPEVGEEVVAIGHPVGMEWTMTKGMVSAVRGSAAHPDKDYFVQTDTAFNPGNSGGPLLNLYGEVIGTVTMKQLGRPGGVPIEGMGFALAAPLVEGTILDEISNVVRRMDPPRKGHVFWRR